MIRVLVALLWVMAFYATYRTTIHLEERGHDLSVRPPASAPATGSAGGTALWEREQHFRDCYQRWGILCGTIDTFDVIPLDAGRVQDSTGERSNPVDRSSRREKSVQPVPRVIYFDRPMDVQREISTCMDYESRVYCESQYPHVNFDKGAGLR
jgi:hypothetical protein